jgi:hypothetical protein
VRQRVSKGARVELTAEQRERINASLTSKGASGICPACGHSPMRISGEPGFQPNLEDTSKGLATAVVVCNKCGFLRHHILYIVDPMIETEYRAAYDKAHGITRPVTTP